MKQNDVQYALNCSPHRIANKPMVTPLRCYFLLKVEMPEHWFITCEYLILNPAPVSRSILSTWDTELEHFFKHLYRITKLKFVVITN